MRGGRPLRAIGVCLLVLAASGVAAAPDTRSGRWQAEREAKRQRLQPPRAGWLERTLLSLEKAERPSLFDFNVAGFYPRVQAIGWGSKTAGGVRFWQPDVGHSRLDVHGSALWSVRGYAYYDVQAGLLPHSGGGMPLRATKGDDVYELGDLRQPEGRFALYGSVRHRKLTALDFFGLGRDSEAADRTDFLLRDTDSELVASYRPWRRAALLARAGILGVEVGPGREDLFPDLQTRFDEAAAPGLLDQPDFFHAGGSLLIDLRDEAGNPHRGGMLALSATRFDDRGGDDYSFVRLGADARVFLPLGSPARVLALRGLLLSDHADDTSRVPFYLQETLGGSHTLRGFRSFRFRGERLGLVQVEYRWEAAPAVELAAFWEGGAVRRTGEDWDLGDLATDYGLGLRVKTFQDVLLRVDLARSDEQTRLLLRFSPSF